MVLFRYKLFMQAALATVRICLQMSGVHCIFKLDTALLLNFVNDFCACIFVYQICVKIKRVFNMFK